MAEVSNAEIRAWGRANGHPVADRGRIPAGVVAAYAAAHRNGLAADASDADRPADAEPEAAAVPGSARFAEPEPEDEAAPAGGASTDPPTYVPPAERRPVGAPGAPPPPAWGAPSPPAPGSPWEPPPGPGGWGPPPRQPMGPDGFAITALVLGLLPILFGLLGIIFGIVALARIRRSGQGGRGMAIAGIVLGSCWLALIAAAFIVGLLRGPERAGDGSVIERGAVALEEIRAGDCSSTSPKEARDTMEVVPCREAHRTEVYATFKLNGTGFPGQAEVDRFALGGCRERLATFVGAERVDTFSLYYVDPNESMWRMGDRDVICMLTTADGSLLPPGSARIP